MLDRLPFKSVWVVDFEYYQPDGWLPDPLCVVARELKSGVLIERWLERDDPGPCPYDTGPGSVFVAHGSNAAEWLCHKVLGWPQPTYVLDTLAEARANLNGLADGKSGLLAVASRYGIPVISTAAKDYGRQIAMQGRKVAEQHKDELLEYCGTDVDTNADLILAMLPEILEREQGLASALGRGFYMVALASVQQAGIPFDCDLFARLQTHWTAIKDRLIEAFDTGKTDCYVNGQFNRNRFSELLDRLGLLKTWPTSPLMGWPTTEEEVFKDRSVGHPLLGPLFQLHYTLGRLRKLTLPIGPDGRHRAANLQPFGTNTGRNAPKGFAFAPAVWVRFLIRPEPGTAIIYADYSSQEIYIAAYKSGDPNMIEAVSSGDAYLWFARKVGLVPEDATKESHREYRDRVLKQFLLSVNYAAEADGIAQRIHESRDFVEHVLLGNHRRIFSTYWRWSDDAFFTSMEDMLVTTAMGWPMRITAKTRARSLRNHRIQACGADVLRMAVTALVANGIKVLAPVHDAILAECAIDDLDSCKADIVRIMQEASEVVLGVQIPVECKVTCYPDHYTDGRGKAMYETVTKLLSEIEESSPSCEGVHKLTRLTTKKWRGAHPCLPPSYI
jgi:DNA polymerase I